MPGPLHGVRVLDFTRFQQGPFATALLADMGAEVVKVEPRIDGEWGRQSERDAETGFSAYFESYNRGKRSITLDIRLPDGQEVVRALVPGFDVVVENFRPGFMARVGLDYESLRPLNERLIYAQASAFGSKGPMSGLGGFDHVAQAVSGLMVEQAGGPGHDPSPALPGAADQISASFLAMGIASALFARTTTGVGQKLEVSLLGSMMAFQGRQVTRYFVTGKQGRARFRRSPLYSHYRGADGWGVAIAAQRQESWAPLCRALGDPSLEHDPRFAGPWERNDHADELEARLEAIFAARTVGEWLERLIAEDVPCGRVNDYSALKDDGELAAQLRENRYLVEVEHSGQGRITTNGTPVTFSGTPTQELRAAPELGQDTEAVLLAAGYDWPAIEHLKDVGAI
jgi:crotonobetainyl-CoA:carnitine CoA-transferase CaiB-like acyl-CoA transferase